MTLAQKLASAVEADAEPRRQVALAASMVFLAMFDIVLFAVSYALGIPAAPFFLAIADAALLTAFWRLRRAHRELAPMRARYGVLP
jgi:hypothetical protein